MLTRLKITSFLLLAIFIPVGDVFAQQSEDLGEQIEYEAVENGVQLRINKHQYLARYRMQTNEDGEMIKELLQYKGLIDVSIDFFEDRISINFLAQTGGKFDGGWNNTEIGSHATGDEVHYDVRHLNITIRPNEEMEFTVGSMPIEYGHGSQYSYLDSDGYLTGYRASVLLGDNELIVTGGYLGDYDEPSVFDRTGSIDELNYSQIVVKRMIGELVAVSTGYSHMGGDDFVRGAVSFDVEKTLGFLDTVLVEDMVQINGENENMFAITLAKNLKGLVFGRNLKIKAVYSYLSNEMEIPLGDKLWEGQTALLGLTLTDVFKGKHVAGDLFSTIVVDIDNSEHYRWESGLKIKF